MITGSFRPQFRNSDHYVKSEAYILLKQSRGGGWGGVIRTQSCRLECDVTAGPVLDPGEVCAEEVQHDDQGDGHEGVQPVLRGPQPLQWIQGQDSVPILSFFFLTVE